MTTKQFIMSSVCNAVMESHSGLNERHFIDYDDHPLSLGQLIDTRRGHNDRDDVHFEHNRMKNGPNVVDWIDRSWNPSQT